jgi:hypothetical protein
MDHIISVISFSLGCNAEKKIDPLFDLALSLKDNANTKTIEEKEKDNIELYDSVSTVHNTWGLLIVLWITVVTPFLISTPEYISQANSNLQTAYIVFSGSATVFSIVALYIVINTIIALAVLPKKLIKDWLFEMGSSIRLPIMMFSLSIISFIGCIFCCFCSIRIPNSNNVASSINVSLLCFGIAIASYYGHLKNDTVLETLRNNISYPKIEKADSVSNVLL